MLKDKITVSIVMITYNHERFIKEAIEGVLMQECNFKIELIISDDKSPDNTEQIVLDLINNHKNGHWIKYTKHKVNKGIMPNFIWAMQQGSGEYIALCEGDDYWIDPLKLQKQVDFLDENKEYSLSCHNAFKLYMNRNNIQEPFNNLKENTDISLKQIVNKWIMPTGSFLFRRKYISSLPDWYANIYSGDLSLTLLLRHYGKVYFFSDIMSTYRINLTGTSASATFGKSLLFVRKQHKMLFEFFNEETNYIYAELINSKLKKLEKEIKFLELKEQGITKAMLRMPVTSLKRIISSLLYKFKKHV